MTPKLYGAPISGNSYKVRLLTGLLDIKVEQIDLDYWAGEHKSVDYLKVNPKGEIPSLVDGDTTFTDSASILVYLAGTQPDPGQTQTPSSFWSTDPVEQAEIVDWLAFAATVIRAGLSRARGIVAFNMPTLTPQSRDAELKDAQEKSRKSLRTLDNKLATDEWLVAGRPTVADVACFPYVALAYKGEVSLDPFPAVRSWVERIRSLPGFVSLASCEQVVTRST